MVVLILSILILSINACFSYLHNSWRNDTNVILADEMGLGKTVQSVSMLGFLQVHTGLVRIAVFHYFEVYGVFSDIFIF